MTKFSKYFLFAFVLLAIVSCSSDSEDPTPEPDVTAPTANFNIAGTTSGSSTEPVVVSNQIQININAQDSGGIAKVEAFIDDQKVGEDTTAPYQITIDISGYTSKNSLTGKFTDYVLKVTVTDTSGNTTSKEQVINIDNELPTVSEVSLLEGTILNGDTNIVTFTIMDNEGINEVKAYLNNELLSAITDANYEININTLNLSDGENTLKIEASDLAENLAVHEVVFISDNTGPEITLESLTENPIMDETILLSPEITDEFSGIASVEFLVGEESQLLIEEGSTFQWEFNPNNFPVGPTSISIIAKDSLGHETIEEFPVEILRRLITINVPTDFFNPDSARLFVFASTMDGQLLDVERIYPDSNIIKLHTTVEIDGDFEYMLTFGEYISGSVGNASEFTTVQNIVPSVLPELNLDTYHRFLNITDSYIIPTENFDFNDDLALVAQGFDYYGGFHQDENGPTGEVSIVQTPSINSSLYSSSYYLALYNNTLNQYSYALLDQNSLPSVITPDMFTSQGVELRFYDPIMNGQAFENSSINLSGFLSQEDFDNNIFHLIHSYGYGYLPANGIPYFISDAFTNYKYTVRINDYFTERTGEPLPSFTPVDWTIDYTFLNNQVDITKSGVGHTVGKIFIDSDPPETINGLSISYRWNIIFDSQKLNQVNLPQIPEEIQSWGFYPIYENGNLKVQQVEIRGYQDISDYNEYVNRAIKDNKFSYTISPNMESKFKSSVQGYYQRAPNFLLD